MKIMKYAAVASLALAGHRFPAWFRPMCPWSRSMVRRRAGRHEAVAEDFRSPKECVRVTVGISGYRRLQEVLAVARRMFPMPRARLPRKK